MSDFITLYRDYACEFTDAPAAIHDRVALSLLSTVINRNLWLWQGDHKLFANLWQIIVAPSSWYRKSSSLSIGQRLLAEHNSKLILADDFSRERLFGALADNPAKILFVREFRGFAEMLDRDYMAGTQAQITDLFDSPPFIERERQPEKAGEAPRITKVYDPFLNILGASTMDWLEDTLTDSAMTGGYLIRYLIVPITDKINLMAWQKKHDEHKRAELLKLLDTIAALKGEVIISSNALANYERWHNKFVTDHATPARLAGFYSRIADYAKKFALLFAINFSLVKIIEGDHMTAACKLADWYANNLSMWLDDVAVGKYQRSRKRILSLIPQAPDSIRREALFRTAKLPKRYLDQVLDELREASQIEVKNDVFKDNSGAGHAIRIYSKI